MFSGTSMSSTYLPLKNEDVREQEDVEPWTTGFRRPKTFSRPMSLGIIGLIVTNVATIAYFMKPAKVIAQLEVIPLDYARQDAISLDTTWNNFLWNTEYSPKNHNQSDQLWDSIQPSHGFIAIDEDQAFEQHWPDSMRLPSDKGKRVYLLEAYHQLHCLRIIQKTFWEAVENRPYTWHPSMHMTHCFDAIRQSVQCHADSTPLYTFGDFTVGDGQLHKCRSWDQLRDFATKHTACYKDSVDPILLGEHFGFCDDGRDGLP